MTELKGNMCVVCVIYMNIRVYEEREEAGEMACLMKGVEKSRRTPPAGRRSGGMVAWSVQSKDLETGVNAFITFMTLCGQYFQDLLSQLFFNVF